MRFAGSSVLVTGGGRGIGRAVAMRFAEEGAAVAVVSRTRQQVDDVASSIGQTGGTGMALVCDVSSEDQVKDTVQRVLDRFGKIDVLVNSAGVFDLGPTISYSSSDAHKVLATNLLGTLFMCQQVGRHMLRRGTGKIVNFASLLSFTSFPERAMYAASKAGVLQLTRALSVEWAGRGVNVNAVAPGMIEIETPHPAIVSGQLTEDTLIARIPAGRRGKTSDIVGPVLFLASTDADYVHGQVVVVDGGWLNYGYV